MGEQPLGFWWGRAPAGEARTQKCAILGRPRVAQPVRTGKKWSDQTTLEAFPHRNFAGIWRISTGLRACRSPVSSWLGVSAARAMCQARAAGAGVVRSVLCSARHLADAAAG